MKLSPFPNNTQIKVALNLESIFKVKCISPMIFQENTIYRKSLFKVNLGVRNLLFYFLMKYIQEKLPQKDTTSIVHLYRENKKRFQGSELKVFVGEGLERLKVICGWKDGQGKRVPEVHRSPKKIKFNLKSIIFYL